MISLEKSIVPPKGIETLLIPIAFVYILCVLEGEEKEETGDVRTPPKGKKRMVGLFLSGIRAISTQLIQFYLCKTLIYTDLHRFDFFCVNLRQSVSIIIFSWILCFLLTDHVPIHLF